MMSRKRIAERIADLQSESDGYAMQIDPSGSNSDRNRRIIKLTIDLRIIELQWVLSGETS